MAGVCGFRSLSADSEIMVACNSNAKSVFEKSLIVKSKKKGDK